MAQFDFLGITLSDHELYQLHTTLTHAGTKFYDAARQIQRISRANLSPLSTEADTLWDLSEVYSQAMTEMHGLGEAISLVIQLREPELANV